jgi:hypothetical protein
MYKLIPLIFVLASCAQQTVTDDNEEMLTGKKLSSEFEIPAYTEMCDRTPDSILCE